MGVILPWNTTNIENYNQPQWELEYDGDMTEICWRYDEGIWRDTTYKQFDNCIIMCATMFSGKLSNKNWAVYCIV